MPDKYLKIVQELNDEITAVATEITESVRLYEHLIEVILSKVATLKKMVLKAGFKTRKDEIFFFKECKPQLVAQLIYYSTIYHIETRMPKGGVTAMKKYLKKELKELHRFYSRHLEFYKYYRTGSTYLDHIYFVRGNHDFKRGLSTGYFESDPAFSTVQDHIAARIIANDRIETFIHDKLQELEKNLGIQQKKPLHTGIQWTGSKVALIEAIYAFHAAGVFNNGAIDIKSIVHFYETHFNVTLGDFYHTYLEIRSRKGSRTKFLDSLSQNLIHKMDEQDERL